MYFASLKIFRHFASLKSIKRNLANNIYIHY